MMNVKRGASLGLIVLIITIVLSGVYTCGREEAVIIARFPDMRARPVTYGTPPYVRTSFMELHWHLPWPLEMTHKISLKPHQYEFEVPVMVSTAPNYFLVLTEEGFLAVHSYDLSDLELMILHVNGEFQIHNLTAWADLDKYGRGGEGVEYYLSASVNEYIGSRIGEMYSIERELNPEISEAELLNTLSEKIIDNPTLLLEDFEQFELTEYVEEMTGTTLLGEVQSKMQEEPISEYL